jgi:hypothetical protein
MKALWKVIRKNAFDIDAFGYVVWLTLLTEAGERIYAKMPMINQTFAYFVFVWLSL